MRLSEVILFLFFIAAGNTAQSQDSIQTRIRQIDSIVTIINRSPVPVTMDSVVTDYPSIGLYMKNYLSALVDGRELKKYSDFGVSERKEKDSSVYGAYSSTFYFSRNELIRVDQMGAGGKKKMVVSFYYEGDKMIYSTLQDEKSESQGMLLLKIGKIMIQKFSSQPNIPLKELRT